MNYYICQIAVSFGEELYIARAHNEAEARSIASEHCESKGGRIEDIIDVNKLVEDNQFVLVYTN